MYLFFVFPSTVEHWEQIHVNNIMFVADVQEGLQGPPIQVNPMRFRPNLLISGGTSCAEDQWRSLKIGNKSYLISPNLLGMPKLS